MNLTNVIATLLEAQYHYDSVAYANCFTETALLVDEGNVYHGKSEIMHWIERANEEYRPVMEPIDYIETQTGSILTAKISGTFDGSPIILKYHFEMEDSFIRSLKVTDY